MRYPALIDVDGDRVVAEFPDCPGCTAAAGPGRDIVAAATVALRRWLESCLADGILPARPSAAVVTRDWFEWIQVPPETASRLLLQWAAAKRISRSELARRAGISEKALAALEDGRTRPSRETLDGVSRALGVVDVRQTAPRHHATAQQRGERSAAPGGKKRPLARRR